MYMNKKTKRKRGQIIAHCSIKTNKNRNNNNNIVRLMGDQPIL